LELFATQYLGNCLSTSSPHLCSSASFAVKRKTSLTLVAFTSLLRNHLIIGKNRFAERMYPSRNDFKQQQEKRSRGGATA
jgi:hypothetical protein